MNEQLKISKNLGWPSKLIPTSTDDIELSSYPDFVGMINQTNVCPGAYSTLAVWKNFSNLDQNSYLLEVACTTGFASRELALMSNCQACGFDLSEKAVAAASYNAELFNLHSKIQYVPCDGYHYSPMKKFTHIILGSSLGFFSDPNSMMNKILSWLTPEGYILATGFYVEEPLPKEAFDTRKEVFGITIPEETYDDINRYYKGLHVIYEDRLVQRQETRDEITHYVDSTIARFIKLSGVSDPKIIKSARDRLLKVKNATNLLRKYQKYSKLVFRYRETDYPNRYVELF